MECMWIKLVTYRKGYKKIAIHNGNKRETKEHVIYKDAW